VHWLRGSCPDSPAAAWVDGNFADFRLAGSTWRTVTGAGLRRTLRLPFALVLVRLAPLVIATPGE